MSDLFSLENKVAVVTGASRGLGRAMALGLAGAGADIIAVASTSDNADGTVAEIEALGLRAVAIGCQQDDPAEVRRAVDECINVFGQVDILVNNAGTIRRAPAEEYSDEDWSAVIDTNLNGVFQFCRGIGKHMLERGHGKIINIASLLSFSGGITVPAYAASKGGVVLFTASLAPLKDSDNIRVNCICPGVVNTPMATKGIPALAAQSEEAAKFIESLNMIPPEEIADIVVQFVTDDSLAGRAMMARNGRERELVAMPDARAWAGR